MTFGSDIDFNPPESPISLDKQEEEEVEELVLEDIKANKSIEKEQEEVNLGGAIFDRNWLLQYVCIKKRGVIKNKESQS